MCTSYFQSDVRIGEADNPGPCGVPENQQFKFALVNPTTVLHREQAFADLQVDCLALAETSATKLVQRQVSHNMKQRGFSVSWSSPVENQKNTLGGQDSLRGQASGVAFMASVPLKPYRDQNIPTALQSTRVHFAYVQYGSTTILQCVLYGLSNGNERARELTNDLLAYVAEVLLSHHGPALLCGDFNHDLQHLPASQLLRQAGYVSILDLHQMLYGTTMPCTFKEQSTRDLILVSTELVGHVTSIGVQQHREFPGHKPVIVTFDLPKGGLTKRMWKAPSNWHELQPKKELIAKSYEQLPDLTFTSDSMMDLQQWSRKVEDSVDMTIAMHHDLDSNTQPYSGLPSEYRGRFQPSNITTKHFRSFAPKARQGDFEPFTEVKTIKATQYVRQLRRLQSLRRRMLKVRTYPMVWHSTWVGLEAEWQAVLAAPGFHGSFTQWVCYHLQWPFLPHTLPNVDILEALEEAVQSLVNHKLKIDADRHQKKMFENHQIDHLFNFDRDSYSKLREPPTQHNSYKPFRQSIR